MRRPFTNIQVFLALVVAGLPACSANPDPFANADSGSPGRDAGARADAPFETGKDDAAGQDAKPDSPPGDGTLSPRPEPKVTECQSSPWTPAPSGVCVVDKTGTGGARLLRGTVLLPNEVLHQGEVLVSDAGIIACAACDCSGASGYADASIITCAEGVISPGLINTHDHITFANNPPVPHGSERYEHRHDWRRGLRGHKKINTRGGASEAVVQFAELRFLLGGATTTAGAGGKKGLLRNIDTKADEQEGAHIPIADSDTFPLGDSDGTLKASGCDYAPSRKALPDIQGMDGYLPHIAEGIDKEAHNELACQTTGQHNLMQRQTGVVHAVALSAKAAEVMHQGGASVIWSPRSNVDLYGNTAPITLLSASGVPIALGTDWVPSGSMNMLRELRCADELNSRYFGKHFTDADLFRMTTVNAAMAIGAEKSLGSLRPGLWADIAVFDGRVHKDYRAVLSAEVPDVTLVLRGGVPLYGDAALLSEPALDASTCEALDVCGTAKKVCVAKDIGGSTTLASLRQAGESIYPMFFCPNESVRDEPSCIPYRTSYADGITETDDDGDGVSNEDDNCKNIFNPIRPMDGTAQADADGDGLGDACDRCPLDAENRCPAIDSDDADGDGVTNGMDNCPEGKNPGQEDGDGDGIGDVCDGCSEKDPATPFCNGVREVTLAELRDWNHPLHVPEGQIVKASGIYVTFVSPGTSRSGNIGLEDGSQKPFTGIMANAAAGAPALSVGNKVTLVGPYRVVFGMGLIDGATITVDDASTSLPFSPLVLSTTADVATGGKDALSHQGLLVRFESTAVFIANADDPRDFDEFVLTGGLRVDDFGHPSLDNNYAVGTLFQSVTGLLGYSFSNHKLWPRGDSDIVP